MDFIQALDQNEFFHGGLVLMLFGGLLALIPRLGSLLIAAAFRHLSVVVELRDRYLIYWVDEYIQEHPYGRTCRVLKGTKPMDGNRDDVVLGPGPGRHLLWHKGSPMIIDRFFDKGGGEEHSLLPQEVMVIRSLGRSRTPVLSFLHDVQADHETRRMRDPRSLIHINAQSGDWLPLRIGSPRPLESVVLPAKQKGVITKRIREYLADQAFYKHLGIPYRLGLLLEGPPGSGKSSLAKALAHEFSLPLYMLDLKMPRMSDFDLTYLLSMVPFRSILLIEDIDCDGLTRNETNGGSRSDQDSKVTLKGLLNAIDGSNAPEGRILILTTNHPERLDDALLRAGRIDMRCHVGHATPEQARSLFRRFFPAANGRSEEFSELVPSGTSMALLQRHLVSHREDAGAAVRALKEVAGE